MLSNHTQRDRVLLWLFPLYSLCLCGSVSHVAQAADAPKKTTYDEHVAPILKDKCFACHNRDKKSGGLILNNYTSLMEGGSTGKIVVPGDSEKSSMFLVATHRQEPYMPPKGDKLGDQQLELIRKWIAEGALENTGSKLVAVNKPKIDIALASAAIGKPEGPPPMPGKLPLDPVVRTPRANAVTAIAGSPWAPLVAIGGQKQVLLYHTDTLELLGVLPFPEGVPQVLKFSRNGSLLLAGGGRGAKEGKVVVWSVPTGERVFQVGDEFDSVLAADISSDQSQIALGGPSKVVRVYSTKDGSLLYEMRKHTDWIYALEYSPDGVLLASADRNGGVCVWETSTGREYVVLRGHSAAVNDLSWRADSNLLATGSEDSTVRLWEMENGNQVKNWGAHGGGVQSVRFSRDGRLVSTGRDRVTKVWDQNGAQQRALEAFPDVGLRVVFTHDAGRVIAGDWTGSIKVWNTADGKPLGALAANPPTVAEQKELALKAFNEAKAKSEQLAAAAAASQAALQKAQAELAAAHKAAADLAAAAKAATDQAAKLKATADQAAAAHKNAQADLTAKDSAAKLLAEAAGKAKEASEKVKGNAELAALATLNQTAAARAVAELPPLQKQVADLGAVLKTSTDQFNAAQAAAQKAAADASAAPKLVEAKLAAIKPATDKANADKAAADQALAALNAAKAALDKWTAAVASGAPASKGN
jgi:hypothetical protein